MTVTNLQILSYSLYWKLTEFVKEGSEVSSSSFCSAFGILNLGTLTFSSVCRELFSGASAASKLVVGFLSVRVIGDIVKSLLLNVFLHT